LVTEGKVGRNNTARLRRGREVVYEGKVATLKRFKDDANEVRAGSNAVSNSTISTARVAPFRFR
jgi:Translation initiation factor 2 (IF-2; GTPase)